MCPPHPHEPSPAHFEPIFAKQEKDRNISRSHRHHPSGHEGNLKNPPTILLDSSSSSLDSSLAHNANYAPATNLSPATLMPSVAPTTLVSALRTTYSARQNSRVSFDPSVQDKEDEEKSAYAYGGGGAGGGGGVSGKWDWWKEGENKEGKRRDEGRREADADSQDRSATGGQVMRAAP